MSVQTEQTAGCGGGVDGGGYKILPARFRRLGERVAVVAQGGDYLILSGEDFARFVGHRLVAGEQIYQDLKSKFFLADHDIDLPVRMLATQYRTKRAFLRHFTSLHMVVVTLRCNHRCRYCQATADYSTAGQLDMTPQVAEKTVEFIFSSPSPEIKIEFQGGEPLLNLPIIRQIVSQARQANRTAGKQLDFVVCTNLSLATEEILNFCRDEGVGISTSLDGPRELHNFGRLMETGDGTYDRVIAGIKLAQKILGPHSVSALMTTTRNSLGKFHQIVDEYIRNGIRGVFFRALNPYGRAVLNRPEIGYSVEEFLESYKQGLEYIIDLNLRGEHFVEQYAALLLVRMLTPFGTGFVDLQSPNGAGIGGVIYNYDGDVYASDEGRMLSRVGDTTFRMGSVLKDDYLSVFDGPVLHKVVENSIVESLPQCSDCAYRVWCGADPIRNHATLGDMVAHRPSGEFCQRNMPTFDYLLQRYHDGSKAVKDIFWSWVTRRSVRQVSEFPGQSEGPA